MMGKSKVSDALQRAGSGESRRTGETRKITPELRPEKRRGFGKTTKICLQQVRRAGVRR